MDLTQKRMARTLTALPCPLTSGLPSLMGIYRAQRIECFNAMMQLDSEEPLVDVTKRLCAAESTIASVVHVDAVVADLLEHAGRVGDHYKRQMEGAMSAFVKRVSDYLTRSYVVLDTFVSNLDDPRKTAADAVLAFDQLSALFCEAFDACAFFDENAPETASGAWHRLAALRSPKFAQLLGPKAPEELAWTIDATLATRVDAAGKSLLMQLQEDLLSHPTMQMFVHVVRLRSYYQVVQTRSKQQRTSATIDSDKVAFGAHLFTSSNHLLGENERQRILGTLPLVDGETPNQLFSAFFRAHVRPGHGLVMVSDRLDAMFRSMQPAPIQMAGDIPVDHVVVMMAMLFMALTKSIPREHWTIRVTPASPGSATGRPARQPGLTLPWLARASSSIPAAPT